MADPVPPTSVHLREQNTGAWESALRHPLITGTADGTIDDAVFDRWLAMNTAFLRTYRRFFIVMSSLSSDTRSNSLMIQGLQWTDHEIAEAEEWAERRDVELAYEPSPQEADYNSFVMATAAQGWARGIVAAYAIESLYFDAWASVRDQASPDNRYWHFIEMWSSDFQRRYVRDLAALVDAVPVTTEAERIFRSVVRLEQGSWDETCGVDTVSK